MTGMLFWIWLFALMLFMHVIEDFHIQGILANMKQRVWWYNQANYSPKYKYDYIPAVIAHGFEWAFFVHIPIFYYIGTSYFIIFSLITTAFLHALIDHLKCNLYMTNLCQDQMFHILQLLLIISTMYIIYG